MANKFQQLSIVAKRLNKMPVNYRNFRGREFVTYYTTWEMLQDIVNSIGTNNNTMENDYRSLENSPLKEMGFRSIALYIDKLTGESIAILGV